MPGFNIQALGSGPPNNLDLLHTHRWLITEFGTVGRDELLIASDLNLPELRIDRQEILGGLLYYKYAKSVRWEDAQVSFYDNGDIMPQLDTWRAMVYTNEGGIQQHSTYKKQCTFELLDNNGGTKNKFVLKNAWPTVISQGRLTYSDSAIKLVTVTLAFDWAEFTSVG